MRTLFNTIGAVLSSIIEKSGSVVVRTLNAADLSVATFEHYAKWAEAEAGGFCEEEAVERQSRLAQKMKELNIDIVKPTSTETPA